MTLFTYLHFFSESVKEALNLNHLQQCSEFSRIYPLKRQQLLIFHMVKQCLQSQHMLRFSSVQSLFVSHSLWPHEPQHARPPCPLQTPRVHPNHVHWVSDAIQASHPLSSPSPPALNLSQHQGLFKGVSSSHQVAKVLEFQLQHQSFQWTPRTDLL